MSSKAMPEPRRVSPQSGYHFFGYYDIQPWDASEGRLLYLEVSFQDREPGPDDVAKLCLVELATGKSDLLAQTRAWNFQQGCMLHWLPPHADSQIIYNDRLEDRFAAIVLDLRTGRRRTLSRPIAALSSDGKTAIGLNFARLARVRPGYGYAGLPDPYEDQPYPEDDGLYVIDVGSGQSRLIVSLRQIFEYFGKPEAEKGRKIKFNHAIINTNDTRVAFLARWEPRPPLLRPTAMFTVALDGSDLRCVIQPGLVSHFDWPSPTEILLWGEIKGQGRHYYLLNELTGESSIIGKGVLTDDGHCSYHGSLRRILTDTYADKNQERALIVFDTQTGQQAILGRFYSPPQLKGPIRCDLHPRWNRSCNQVSFDSAHEGVRQVYVIDVPEAA